MMVLAVMTYEQSYFSRKPSLSAVFFYMARLFLAESDSSLGSKGRQQYSMSTRPGFTSSLYHFLAV